MAARQARKGNWKPVRYVAKMALRWMVRPVCTNCGGWNFRRPLRFTCQPCSEELLLEALFAPLPPELEDWDEKLTEPVENEGNRA